MDTNSMLPLSDERKIQLLQNEFTIQFPFLRIMFYSEPHSKQQGSSTKFEGDKSTTKFEAQCNRSEIELLPTMQVSTLKQRIQQNYGLLIKVFRKSGDAWIDTTPTSNWTLEKQNAQGKTERT